MIYISLMICEELTHWKRLWCWEGLGAGGEGDDRGCDGWMASLTRWRWVWVNSGSWWWTGRPGVLRFMGSQRVGHDWVTELNWTELNWFYPLEFEKWVAASLTTYHEKIGTIQGKSLWICEAIFKCATLTTYKVTSKFAGFEKRKASPDCHENWFSTRVFWV